MLTAVGGGLAGVPLFEGVGEGHSHILRRGPTLGIMLNQHPVDQLLDDLLLVQGDAGDRLEAELQILVRSALVLIEQQQVGADREGHGQPPQYGWYGAAPSATFGYGVPAPVERPLTVRAAIGAFVGSIVLSVVAQVITFLNWDTVEDFVLGGTADFSQEEAEVFAGMTDAFGTIGLVIGALFTALFALFVWFAWKGHNWARVVLWILAGLGVILARLGWAAGTPPLPGLDALAGVALVLPPRAPSSVATSPPLCIEQSLTRPLCSLKNKSTLA